jgi:hypothetical protein
LVCHPAAAQLFGRSPKIDPKRSSASAISRSVQAASRAATKSCQRT